MPDSLRFLLILGGFIGGVYLIAWLLAVSPPQPQSVVKDVANAALRAK